MATAVVHKKMIFEEPQHYVFYETIHREGIWFQQDGTTPHLKKKSLNNDIM